ncbi:GntR family transcriptional regulator [Metabacillus arenae]|uniref:GntR family transcriptional regulator n=1 Tax=Metabacillus arenae TaxID=2771434 RepID=A0A926NMB0_9BACI|nr:GntR family transcriptional regulator [Metabacillus arenae]MBD1380637.1 GntR family transcriptional regulator [Metabacillus arenae]
MKLPITIREDSREPIYHQIEAQLKALIVSGHLPAGNPLPSIRVLAKDLACSVITTRRAYQNLELSGYIKTTQGKGTFVAKVDEAKIAMTKRSTVQNALKTAIDTALKHDYSIKEIESMFAEILQEKEREA